MHETVRTHDVTLRAGAVVLRPLTEGDWGLVLGWWNDPEIACYSDSNEGEYSLGQVQKIMRSISRSAYCFVIEFESRPVEECWLQQMNVGRVLRRYPGLECRRIDIEIQKDFWDRGIGSTAIGLLVEFGFESERADGTFAMDVGQENGRSLRAFGKCGFGVEGVVGERFDLVVWGMRRHEAPVGLGRRGGLGARKTPHGIPVGTSEAASPPGEGEDGDGAEKIERRLAGRRPRPYARPARTVGGLGVVARKRPVGNRPVRRLWDGRGRLGGLGVGGVPGVWFDRLTR